MLVTASGEYACLAMMELAARYNDPKPVRLIEVCEKHLIPQSFLVQIMLQMKASGLVQTTRGSAGGYQLARPPEQITLADILGVLDRMDEPEVRTSAPSSMSRRLQRVWKGLAENRMVYLEQFKLSDLIPQSLVIDYVI